MVLLPILTYGRRVRRLSRASQDRVADLGVYAGEALDAIRTVQAFVHEAADRRHFSARVEAAFQAARQRVPARAMLTAVVMLLVLGAVSIILWIGGHDVLSGRIRSEGRRSGKEWVSTCRSRWVPYPSKRQKLTKN